LILGSDRIHPFAVVRSGQTLFELVAESFEPHDLVDTFER
jgi:hypothetical protein